MVLGGVLHYGEAEAGAAGLARVALVHAVEALEYPPLRLARDADAVVPYRQPDVSVRERGDVYAGPSAGPRVFYGVVSKVPDYLPEQLPHAADRPAAARYGKLDAPAGGLLLERGGDLGGEGEHVRILARELLALVEAGEVDDVLHKADKARGLAAYTAEEAVAVLGLYKPALEQLGRAHDGMQRGLELMADVGRKFAPQALGALLFRHVHGQEHGAAALAAGEHGAHGKQVFPLAAAYIALGALAAGAPIEQLAQLRAAV